MSEIKAIETRYKGYRFRSRLEARWAVFFDKARIAWEYEREGFDMPVCGNYLPDFWLPELSCWIEIKGQEATAVERERCFELRKVTGFPVSLFGPISEIDFDDGESFGLDEEGEELWDNAQSFCVCTTGRHVGIHFDGRGARIKCDCKEHTHEAGGRGHSGGHQRLRDARLAARAARFEHGETPCVR